MRHLLILSLIILVVIISGCLSQDNGTITSKTDGIIINDFSFSHSPIYANDNVVLRLEVQNVGGSEAELQKIQIYGVDFDTSSDCGGSTERAWCSKTGTDISGFGENGLLDQPDPDINFEGGKYYNEWKLKAPSNVAAATNYDFKVRVNYYYETTFAGTIRIINENYLLTLSEEEQQKLFNSGGLVSTELTNGPISVTPFSGRHFIVAPSETVDRTIKFKIENVGKGYPYVNDITNGNYYIEIKEGGIIGDVISGCNINNPTYPMIKLSSGKSHIIECKFNAPNNVENQIDKPFKIVFAYSYYIDGSTSIKVNPTN